MAPPKIRFLHEQLEVHPVFSRMPAERLFDLQAADLQREAQLMERMVQTGEMATFDMAARKTVALSVAGFLVMQAKGAFSRADAPVARYVVADGLFNAMLETEPPKEAFTPDELKLPQDSVIVRWPTGEETYAMTAARYEMLAPKVLGFPITLGPGNPNRLVWIQSTHNYNFGGELWFGEISDKPIPHVGITPPPEGHTVAGKLTVPPGYDEVSWREALLRSLLVYLTTGLADAVEIKPAKARKQGDGLATEPHRLKDRHFSYVHLGSRTRMLTAREVEDECRKTGKPLENSQRVCGHWKQQAHGPQFSKRKWLWIKPYVRGPEGSEPVDRVRIVTL